MRTINKNIYALLFMLALVSGLVFATHQINKETRLSSKALLNTEKKAALSTRKKWEASPDGIKYKEWEVSPAGKKVRASYDKIKKNIKTFTAMEAVVTSLTFKRTKGKSTGPKWLIVTINGEEYMMQFIPKDFQQFNSLKVNDKIIVKSRTASCSNNHPFLILSSDYIAHQNKILFERDFSKNNGC